ncbi:MAG: hypothetical protein BHW64_05465 [Candidatus Melainabacteria bacterium LEY3_CP_29_8]|nr:MAG: hypothetical protein BHW64_05465 [Candidatus Melainabacteria bacterium LEY3_CP_29_8]
MKIHAISNTNFVQRSENVKFKKANPSFGKLIPQVSKDSQSEQVKKATMRFITFMRNLTTKAQSDKNSQALLKNLIGEKATNELVTNRKEYTQKTDSLADKALPLSGQGTRGAEIRKSITDQLGIEETNKTIMPLPAILGEDEEGPVYLTTSNNELLHMMQAQVLSPDEEISIIETEKSDGDATVIVEGLKQGKISVEKPLLFTYTDDVGSNGEEDYESLIKEYEKMKNDSYVKVISRGYVATKEETDSKLGAFFPNADGKSYYVFEKPTIDELDEALGENDEVLTNIGKTLFTPSGLKEIASRLGDPQKEDTLKKDDHGERKWHVTEGILRPAGREGTLKVIRKDGQFNDVGNGTIFTDTMVRIAKGAFKGICAPFLEKQIQKNVTAYSENKKDFATLNYNGTPVTLPMTDGALKNIEAEV